MSKLKNLKSLTLLRIAFGALVVVGLILAACGGSKTGQPATTDPQAAATPAAAPKMANQMVAALQPKVGEQVTTRDSNDTGVYMADRLAALLNDHPEWTVANQPAAEGPASQSSQTYKFSDGSSVTFVSAPIPGKGSATKLLAVKLAP
jgi:hypothetical protein